MLCKIKVFRINYIPHNELTIVLKFWFGSKKVRRWLIHYLIERYFRVLKALLYQLAGSTSGVGGGLGQGLIIKYSPLMMLKSWNGPRKGISRQFLPI